MKTRNCTECRKRIHAEEQEEYLKKQYHGIKDAVDTIACLTTAAVLAVQVQRGRSKLYIQELFKDILMMYETPSVLGEPIELTAVMKQLEEEYGINFKRISVNFTETEKEYIKGCKEVAK